MAEIASGQKINNFSVGFDEKGFDEVPFAKAVVKHLGTNHTELYAQPKDALELIDKMPDMYDEPL